MRSLARHFLLDPTVTYLNHGSFGATPRPVFRDYRRWQRELERQPTEFLGRRFAELMRAARTALAEYVGTRPDNLVYVTNATLGVNIVAHSLELGPDDEVLATDHEYGALDRAWRFLAERRGFRYINQHIPVPLGGASDFAARLWEGVTPGTRVIFLSHITSPTGLIFPVEEVCRRARQAGILSVVDGAHAPGQVPLSLDALGADFYAGNLHKWLCAPKGAAFLYARPEAQPLLRPLVVSWGWESERPGPSAFVDQQEWQGTRDIAAFLAVPQAIRFQTRHGWEAVRAECHALADEARRRIEALTELPPLATPDQFGQMAVAALPNVDVEAFQARLYREHRVEVPLFRWSNRTLLRISIQGYNEPRDVDRLTRALRAMLP